MNSDGCPVTVRGEITAHQYLASRVDQTLPKVGAEQQQARVTPKQATPFFVSKLTRLAKHLQTGLHTAKTKREAIERYVEIGRQMGVNLTRGYLFRPTTPN